jgi:pyrroline-5-carboxylate reductase
MGTADKQIGFIGGGNMGQAIIRGLIQAGHSPRLLSVADPDSTCRAELHNLHAGLFISPDNFAVAEKADALVLAVKPQMMRTVAEEMAGSERPADQLIVSIAAGTTIKSLRAWLGSEIPVVRVMPNQPALIGAGISVLMPGKSVTEPQRELADYIASAIGTAVWLDDESLIDAATAVSGSGPAYFYLLMELIQNSALEFGFSKDVASKLTVGTALGAARIADTVGPDLADLRRRVTSPGGTTAAALKVLEDAEIRDIFRRALGAARDRAAELGKSGSSND